MTLDAAGLLRVDTAGCYRAFDELRGRGWRPRGTNHLEAAGRACRAAPGEHAGVAARRVRSAASQLAGSGSTMFLEGHLVAGADSLGRDRSRGHCTVSPANYHAAIGVAGELFTGGATLEAGSLQHLLVLLLAHALTALLD